MSWMRSRLRIDKIGTWAPSNTPQMSSKGNADTPKRNKLSSDSWSVKTLWWRSIRRMCLPFCAFVTALTTTFCVSRSTPNKIDVKFSRRVSLRGKVAAFSSFRKISASLSKRWLRVILRRSDASKRPTFREWAPIMSHCWHASTECTLSKWRTRNRWNLSSWKTLWGVPSRFKEFLTWKAPWWIE